MRPDLSPRAKQIAACLLEGCQDREIASRLGIPVRVVKWNMRTMFKDFEITWGLKRIRLAVLLYQEQQKRGEL